MLAVVAAGDSMLQKPRTLPYGGAFAVFVLLANNEMKLHRAGQPSSRDERHGKASVMTEHGIPSMRRPARLFCLIASVVVGRQ